MLMPPPPSSGADLQCGCARALGVPHRRRDSGRIGGSTSSPSQPPATTKPTIPAASAAESSTTPARTQPSPTAATAARPLRQLAIPLRGPQPALGWAAHHGECQAALFLETLAAQLLHCCRCLAMRFLHWSCLQLDD